MKLSASLILATLTIGGHAQAAEANFYEQVKACHDAVWALKRFAGIPNAGVSADISGYDDKRFYSCWIVDWDNVQKAGKCLMDRNKPVVREIVHFS